MGDDRESGFHSATFAVIGSSIPKQAAFPAREWFWTIQSLERAPIWEGVSGAPRRRKAATDATLKGVPTGQGRGPSYKMPGLMSSAADELSALAQRRVGTTLRGKYRIDDVLGVGGMAVVYRATHRNQAELAIKMLHPELSLRDDVRTRFLREGYAANSVKHPGAVLVVDDDVAEDGTAFLVMEMLRGASVESLWERAAGRLPVPAVLAVAEQLLDVLASAHDKRIVHRDVKPANLFALRDGTLKVLDFGIARARDAAASGAHGTGTGILLGTPAYMAPEQAYAKSSEIDGQTDLWAVGATMFTMLSAQSVHVGDNAAQLMIHAATTRARALASVAPEVPAPVAWVVDRALAFEKGARWPDAQAMRAAVEEASMMCFGRGTSRADLAALVPRDARTSGTPRANPTLLAAVPEAVAPTAPVPAATTLPLPRETPNAANSAALVGTTTSQPVASGRSSRPAGVPERRSWIGFVLALGVAVVVGGIAVAAWWASAGHRAAVAMPSNVLPVPSASPPLPPSPIVYPPTVSSSPTPAPAPAPSSGPLVAFSALRRAPALPPPRPAPTLASPPTTAPAPSCRTVFDRYDSNYEPIYRQVCP